MCVRVLYVDVVVDSSAGGFSFKAHFNSFISFSFFLTSSRIKWHSRGNKARRHTIAQMADIEEKKKKIKTFIRLT